MKNGALCKNITDALVLIMAFVALFTLLVEFLSFDPEGYIVEDPRTHEDIEVSSMLDDPYIVIYVEMLVGFLLAAIIGFAGRRAPLASLIGSVILLALVLYEYKDGPLGQVDFGYVLVAFVGLAGSITYLACYYAEKAEEKKSVAQPTEQPASSEIQDNDI